MEKPIHPAVAEHVMEENERLRGLLREVIACQAAHYGDGTGLHLAMITLADRLKGALSQQAEPAPVQICSMGVECEKYGCHAAAHGAPERCGMPEPAPAQDERSLSHED